MRFLCKRDYGYPIAIFLVLFGACLAVGPVALMTTATAWAENQTTATPAPQPRLFFPEIKHDFGSVMEGVEIKHDFVIENKGQAPLLIHGVRPG